MAFPRVVLRPKRARPFFARHPWVLPGSIDRLEGQPAAGSEVEVATAEGVFVARGLFNPESRIPVRLYRWLDSPLDDDFWRSQIVQAVALRRDVLGWYEAGRACRLIYSESDGLSGLVVDSYDRWLVAQFGSRALWERRDAILRLLLECSGSEGLIARIDPAMLRAEGFSSPPPEVVLGSSPGASVEFQEAGIIFRVALGAEQKTGFYLDQRENRQAVAALAGGSRVLDLFCYTGGFALHAARSGAKDVLAIDSSGPAVARAQEHGRLNGLASVSFVEDDVTRALQRLRDTGQRFDLVICDPPKYAPSHRDVDRALGAYLRLQRAAVDVLNSGGILATCSCSGHVDRWAFQSVVAQAAELAGRPIQLLEARGQAADHPVSVACPETEYLKCLICRVL